MRNLTAGITLAVIAGFSMPAAALQGCYLGKTGDGTPTAEHNDRGYYVPHVAPDSTAVLQQGPEETITVKIVVEGGEDLPSGSTVYICIPLPPPGVFPAQPPSPPPGVSPPSPPENPPGVTDGSPPVGPSGIVDGEQPSKQ